MVGDEYEDLFPGQVLKVETLHKTQNLEGLVADYEKLNQQLWDLIGDYSSKTREGKKFKRKQVRDQGCTHLPERSDSGPGLWSLELEPKVLMLRRGGDA